MAKKKALKWRVDVLPTATVPALGLAGVQFVGKVKLKGEIPCNPADLKSMLEASTALEDLKADIGKLGTIVEISTVIGMAGEEAAE